MSIPAVVIVPLKSTFIGHNLGQFEQDQIPQFVRGQSYRILISISGTKAVLDIAKHFD
jgi:hypothetical protein